MGTVLLQDDHPIAYASKSLTPAQQSYAQIEKEMLAILFGCHKFHDYRYMDYLTDHKPLQYIQCKPIHAAPTRLQRMIMSVQRYTIQVSYKPGKELLVADTLSRSPLPDLVDDLEYQEYDINMLHTLPITEAKLEEFKQSTKPGLDDGGARDEEEERHEQEQEQTQEESTNQEHEPAPPVRLRRSQRKTAHPYSYASTYTRVSDITSMEGEM